MSTKTPKMQGENLKSISEVDFSDPKALIRLLGSAGIIKNPGTKLSDLQRASLNLYSPTTLRGYCQYLSSTFVSTEKKVDLVNMLLDTLTNVSGKTTDFPTPPSPIKSTKHNPVNESSKAGIPTTPVKHVDHHTDTHATVPAAVSPSPNKTAKAGKTNTKVSTKAGPPDRVVYEITDRSPGYSKDKSVLRLVKPFKAKKIRRHSRDAALHYLLLQTTDKFVILNQEDPDDLLALGEEFIFSNNHCHPSVIGWDVFGDELEACSVRDRLNTKSGSVTKPSQNDIYSDDSSVEGSDIKGSEFVHSTMAKVNDEMECEGDVNGTSSDVPEGKEVVETNERFAGVHDLAVDEGRTTSAKGPSEPEPPKSEAKRKIVFNTALKVAKFKTFTYDKSKIKSDSDKKKMQIVVSQPMTLFCP